MRDGIHQSEVIREVSHRMVRAIDFNDRRRADGFLAGSLRI